MEIVRFGNAATFRMIGAGECFAFAEDEPGKMALKLAGESCVLLGREPPSLVQGKAASDPVFRFADAKFMPSHDPANIQSGSNRIESGNAVLCGERLLLVVDAPSGAIFIDVAAGAIVPELPADPLVVFTAWRIVQKWLDDEHHTLCLYETRGQKKLGFLQRP
jgi:hypothetical protein